MSRQWRRSREPRRYLWRAARSAALLFGVALVALVSLPPMRIETSRVHAQIGDSLGLPLRVREAHWSGGLRPELRLDGIEAAGVWFPRLPVTMSVASAELSGSSLLVAVLADARERAPDFDHARLEGIAVDAGPLRLRSGSLSLENDPGGIRVSGRAEGTYGGWVEVEGTTAVDGSPLRIHLSDLVVPVPPLPLFQTQTDEVAAAPEGGVRESAQVRASGAVSVRRDGREAERVDLELRLEGPRGAGRRLQGAVRGTWVRNAAWPYPNADLSAHLHIRELSGSRRLHAIHGPVSLRARLERGRLRASADLRALRLVAGEWLEKQPGDPARLELRGRMQGRTLERAVVELVGPWGRLRASRSGFQSDAGGRAAARIGGTPASADLHTGDEWHLESSWLDLRALRERVPWLRKHHFAGVRSGRARLSGRWSPGRGLRARAEVRDLALAGLPVVLPRAELEIEPRAARVRCTGLRVADQPLDLAVRAAWPEAEGPLRIQLVAGANRVDLKPLADEVHRLVGGPRAEDWREALVPLVQALRADPRWLDALFIEAAELTLGRVVGLGIDERDVALHLRLLDGVLHVEPLAVAADAADATTGARFELRLRGWMPRVVESTKSPG